MRGGARLGLLVQCFVVRCKGLKVMCECPEARGSRKLSDLMHIVVLYGSGSPKSEMGLTGLRIKALAGLHSFCSGRVNQAEFSRESEATEYREMSQVL